MKTPPSVAIYEALIKKGYKIVNSRMAGIRLVYVTYCVGTSHNETAAYAAVQHSWEADETYDIEEIIQEIDKNIKDFYNKDKMDEALD